MYLAMWFSISSLFLYLILSLLLHLRSLLISSFLFPFLFSTTPHPIFVLLFFSFFSSTFLPSSTFPLSSSSHSSHLTSFSPIFSQDTHPTTLHPIPFPTHTNLLEYVLHRLPHPTNTHSMMTRSKAGVYK